MDPELYVFPQIRLAPLKILASSAVFLLVLVAGRILMTLLPGSHPLRGDSR
jgi:hypothetical protein